MPFLRTPQTQQAYEQWKENHPGEAGCFLCTREPKVSCGHYWKIIANDFPYDAIASASDLLVPLRHFARKRDMSTEESAELSLLLEKMDEETLPGYDAILENFTSGRTQKAHYHIHCVAIKN